MTSRECAGCMACGVASGHSYRTCVLLGAALHRRFLKLDSHKDMKDVVDVIFRLLLWDWRVTGVDDVIECLSNSPSCDVIAAGSNESDQIFFIDARTGEKILCPVKVDGRGGVGGVKCVTFNGTGDTIVAGCGDGSIFFIDTATSQVREPPLSCGDIVWDVSFSHDGQHIAAACHDCGVYIFSLNQQSQDFEMRSESPLKFDRIDTGVWGVRCVTFNGTGDTIVAGCYIGNIFFINTTTGQVREPRLKVDGDVSSLDFSPCGTKIAAASNNDLNKKYEIKTLILNPLSGDWEIGSEPPLSCGSPVYTSAWKDNMIVAGCENGKIKLFKLNESQDWGEIQSEPPLTRHKCAVTAVAFSADGQWIVSGSHDRNIRLWDARPG